MPFVVQQCKEDPTIDVLVTDAMSGAPARMVVLGGVAAIGPASTPGIRVSVIGRQPTSDAVAFHLQGAPPIAAGVEARIQAEASLAQVVVDARRDNVDVVYGIGDVVAALTPSTDGAWQWVRLSLDCYGAMPLAVRYRVTVFLPA